MKPHQLFAALMAKEGLGPLPLAKKMGKPKLQSQIHRFVNGEVDEPARTTAEPLALYFNVPVDAIYSMRVATEIAKERNVSALSVEPASKKSTKRGFARVPSAQSGKPPSNQDQAPTDTSTLVQAVEVLGARFADVEPVFRETALKMLEVLSVRPHSAKEIGQQVELMLSFKPSEGSKSQGAGHTPTAEDAAHGDRAQAATAKKIAGRR